jgi:hypothetical protein
MSLMQLAVFFDVILGLAAAITLCQLYVKYGSR